MERSAIIEHYRQHPEVDVLIIGGGINGIGTLRDLSLQGVSVLLVDRADLCSGATAASTRLAHGGIRYLENGEFRLVREALLERNRLLHNAPHAVRPFLFTIPIYSHFSGLLNAPLKFVGLLKRPNERGSLVIRIGMAVYDWFTRSNRATPTHKMLSRAAALEKHPGLNPDIVGAGTYYDGLMEYAERIGVELALDAEADSPNVHALNYAHVQSASEAAVHVQDTVSGDTFEVKPRIVINAAGAWIDFVNRDMQHPTRFIGGTKGSHIIVENAALLKTLNNSALYFENKDGRLLFVCPIQDRVLIGTTDIRIENPDHAICTDEEIDYFLTSLKTVLPGVTVDRSQIVYTFSGVRPLPNSEAGFAGMISRDHSIQFVEPDDAIHFPIYSLVGGKWTSFRAFSEQVTDKVLDALGLPRKASTADLAIGGGRGYPKNAAERAAWLQRVGAQTGVSQERLQTLFRHYGTRAEAIAAHIAAGDDSAIDGLPDYSHREIDYLCQHEKIVHIDDLIMRRSLLAMLGRINRKTLHHLGAAIGKTLGWSEQQLQDEIARVDTMLEKQHGVSAARLGDVRH